MSIAEKSFRKGEVIIKEGDMGDSFFCVMEGKVGVYADYTKKEPFRLAILEAGEFFGEMAILEEYPRSATIVAESNVVLIEIPGNEMMKFFGENPDQVIELMRHLGNRIQAMAADYADAEALLKQMRESDEAKKSKSLFSKIKKHINTYQANKNKLNEPDTEKLRKEFEEIKGKETGELKTYGKGMIVFKEGKEDDCMYILHDGAVGMYSNYRKKDEQKLAEVQAISFFGEMGIISDEPRSVSAVAEAGGATVETVRQEDIERMVKTCPVKVEMILRHMSFRLRRLNLDFLNTCKEITETYGN